MTYTVYGDYGYANETVLHTSTSRLDAIEWAKEYAEWDNDEYEVIEVGYHAEDGEYVTVFTDRRVNEEECLIDEW